MNIKKSLISKYQSYIAGNFDKSKYGKSIKKLKDIHKGERCFIIGNGPSLTANDLTLLHNNKEITFASNRIYNIFNDTKWRPDYYASEDEIIVKSTQREIEKINSNKRFIPINLKWYHEININNADYFYMKYNSDEYTNTFGFCKDLSKGITCKGTVTITLMQIAIYMGISEIYLIGMDHNYSVMQKKDGSFVVDKTVKDYFSDKYENKIENQLIHNVDSTTVQFEKFALFADMMNVKVYNATRGGKLEVYPRVDLDVIVGGKNAKS